jgi:hypothetical protein
MIAIVVIGLLLGMSVGAVRLRQRRDDLKVRALEHAIQIHELECVKLLREQMLRTDAFLTQQLERARSSSGRDPEWLDKSIMNKVKADKPQWLEEAPRIEKVIAYHAAMQRKYEDATRRPWLPVAPDPPEPKWMTSDANGAP